MSISIKGFVIVVQSLSPVQLLANSWTAAHQAHLSSTISWNLLRFMSIESVMPSNHLIFFYPLLFLPSIFPSTRVFSNESTLCIRQLKHWSFTFQWIFRVDFSLWLIVWSPCWRDSQVFCRTTVQKHEFFGAQPSLGFPGGSDGKESTWKAEDLGSIPGKILPPWEDPLEESMGTYSRILA